VVSSGRAESHSFLTANFFSSLVSFYLSSLPFPLLSPSLFSLLTFRYFFFPFIPSFLSFPFLGLLELFLYWGTSTSLLARKERFHKKSLSAACALLFAIWADSAFQGFRVCSCILRKTFLYYTMMDGNELGYDRALLCRRWFFCLFFLLFYNTEGVLYCHCLMPSTISGRIITGSRLWRVELSMISYP